MKKIVELLFLVGFIILAMVGIDKAQQQFDTFWYANTVPVVSIQSDAHNLEEKSKSNQTPANQRANDARRAQQLHKKAIYNQNYKSHERKRFGKDVALIIPAIAFICFMVGTTDDGPIYVNQ